MGGMSRRRPRDPRPGDKHGADRPVHADDLYELISDRAVNAKPLILDLQQGARGRVQPVPAKEF